MEIMVNDANFKEVVLESDVPVLVDFWAEWCGPCRMIAPLVEEIAKEYQGRVKVCKMNVEEAQSTASEYGIMNIPTLIVFKGGQIAEKVIGVVPKSDIVSRLDRHL
ncbi:MAG: thioredoxin [Candidatus Omnitrophica bacterium]|nr:thioredoxin [Candidatus Omnitrophota bacterium]